MYVHYIPLSDYVCTHIHMCVCVCAYVYICIHMKVKVLAAQSCPNLCDRMNCSLPGSSVYEILQVRILELVVIPFSRGFSQPRDTHTHRHIYTHYNILY